MGNINVNKDEWKLNEEDGLWYATLKAPFECNEDTETILELADEQDYIDEHKATFDSLNNGKTGNNEVIISCDIQPDCDMSFNLKTLEEAGGRIMYDKDGNAEYIPDNNGFDFSALGGLMGSGFDPSTILDQDGKPLELPEVEVVENK